jgi:hypothetical protein
MVVVSALAAVAAGCGAGAGVAPSGNLPPLTTTQPSKLSGLNAKAIVAASLRAAKLEGSAHVRLVSDAIGGYIVDDEVGHGVGSQKLHVSELRMDVRIVGTTAYVKVTHTGGEFFIGMAGVSPARYVNRWIIYRPGDKDYKTVASGGTMASMLSVMKPKGKISKGSASIIDGHPAVGVWGGFLGSRGCLYVSTVGKPLPVRLTVTTVGGTDVTLTFGRWGEKVAVTAPAGAIPAASLLQSAR